MSSGSSDLLALRFQAALDGSSRALGELLEAVRAELYEAALRQLGSSLQAKAGASDLVQESLLAAAVGFPQFKGNTVGEFKVWIARILEHRTIDLARKFRNSTRDVSRELSTAQPHYDLADGTQIDPQDRVAQAESIQRLLEHLNTLPTDERNLILWRYHEEVSFDEIARRLGWPRETTRRRWYEVVGRIARHLENNT